MSRITNLNLLLLLFLRLLPHLFLFPSTTSATEQAVPAPPIKPPTDGDGGGDKKGGTEPELPCTITSPHTGNFFDLRPLIRTKPTTGTSTTPSSGDWTSHGYDYLSNFTINICAPVLYDANHARGILAPVSPATHNVSALYVRDDEVFSIGSVSTRLLFRGRKLVLEYRNGSPCPGDTGYRKSTVMSFLCDREGAEGGEGEARIAFVGQSDECAYFFEVRTKAACPTFQETASLGPVAIFAIIIGVFAVVYLVGGCVYQRTVMNARGWRQLPNYHIWLGVLSFVFNIIATILSSLASLVLCCFRPRHKGSRIRLPSQGSSTDGTSAAYGHGRGGSRGRIGANVIGSRWVRQGSGGFAAVGLASDEEEDEGGIRTVEDENRLLDQLDEEWGDE